MIRALAAAVAAMAALSMGCGPSPEAVDDFPLKDGRRVVFLGDSITNYGVYIHDIEAYLVTRFPDRKVEIIDLGLSSETASGLSEPGHPFPRPDVRERLGRALEMARPDLVVVCYGMNDGIYHPPDPDRLAAYKRGIEEVVARARRAGAEVVVATPPPFDPEPIRGRLRPPGAVGFSYGFLAPFEGYDGVLRDYGRWLLSKRAEGWVVVDVHDEVARFVERARKVDPAYTLAPDGVHPDATGHWLIARAFLMAWDAPAEVDVAVVDARTLKAKLGNVGAIARDGDSLSIAWTTRIPMPHDPKWDPRLNLGAEVDARFNRHRLTVLGLDRPRYAVVEGGRVVGEATREELARGLDLLRFPELSTNRRAAELRPLVDDRRWTLDPAWLQAVGHGPPILPEAPPLDEAMRRGDALEARIRELARPVPVTIVLRPIAG